MPYPCEPSFRFGERADRPAAAIKLAGNVERPEKRSRATHTKGAIVNRSLKRAASTAEPVIRNVVAYHLGGNGLRWLPRTAALRSTLLRSTCEIPEICRTADRGCWRSPLVVQADLRTYPPVPAHPQWVSRIHPGPRVAGAASRACRLPASRRQADLSGAHL